MNEYVFCCNNYVDQYYYLVLLRNSLSSVERMRYEGNLTGWFTYNDKGLVTLYPLYFNKDKVKEYATLFNLRGKHHVFTCNKYFNFLILKLQIED